MVLYIGCLGYWTQIGVIPAKMEWAYRALMAEPKEKGRKKISAERSGVLELRAMPGKDEVVSVGSCEFVFSSLLAEDLGYVLERSIRLIFSYESYSA